MGFGDLLNKAGGNNLKASYSIKMELEATDELKSNIVQFKFIAFKTSEKINQRLVPRRMQILMRFFSYPEIQTDTVSLVLPGHSADLTEITPGQTYYLAKDRFVETVQGKV